MKVEAERSFSGDQLRLLFLLDLVLLSFFLKSKVGMWSQQVVSVPADVWTDGGGDDVAVFVFHLFSSAMKKKSACVFFFYGFLFSQNQLVFGPRSKQDLINMFQSC